jgi:hypothetical protein
MYGGTVTINLHRCHAFFLCTVSHIRLAHQHGGRSRVLLQRLALTASCSAVYRPVTRPDTVANNVFSRIDISDHEVHLQFRSLFHKTTILKIASFRFVRSVHSTDL